MKYYLNAFVNLFFFIEFIFFKMKISYSNKSYPGVMFYKSYQFTCFCYNELYNKLQFSIPLQIGG
jgi:hypothetical protein